MSSDTEEKRTTQVPEGDTVREGLVCQEWVQKMDRSVRGSSQQKRQREQLRQKPVKQLYPVLIGFSQSKASAKLQMKKSSRTNTGSMN